MEVTSHPYLESKLKKESSYTSAPPVGLHGLFYSKLYLIKDVSYKVWTGSGLAYGPVTSSSQRDDVPSGPVKYCGLRSFFRGVM